MSADQPVLDLDSPTPPVDARGDRVRLRDIRVPLWGVVVVAVVVAVVSVGLTRMSDADRTRREQAAVLRIMVSVPPDADLAGGGTSQFASYNSVLQVVNAGPLPVEVETVSSSSLGIQVGRLNAFLQAVAVPAGETRTIAVGISLVCRQWARDQPIELTVDVTTADGRRHREQNLLSVGETAWADQLRSACPPGV